MPRLVEHSQRRHNSAPIILPSTHSTARCREPGLRIARLIDIRMMFDQHKRQE